MQASVQKRTSAAWCMNAYVRDSSVARRKAMNAEILDEYQVLPIGNT